MKTSAVESWRFDDALLLNQVDVKGEKFASTPVSLHAIVMSAINGASAFAASRHVRIELGSSIADLVLGECSLLSRALQSLLETAAKFSEAGQVVRISSQLEPEGCRVIMESNGGRFPNPVQKFFETSALGEAVTRCVDLDLAVSVAHSILSVFGGSVAIENLDGAGIRLTVLLKTAASQMWQFKSMSEPQRYITAAH